MTKEIGELISPLLDKRMKAQSLTRIVHELTRLGSVSLEEISKIPEPVSSRSWHKFLKAISRPDQKEVYNEVRRLILLGAFFQPINKTSNQMRDVISSVLYIGPARSPKR